MRIGFHCHNAWPVQEVRLPTAQVARRFPKRLGARSRLRWCESWPVDLHCTSESKNTFFRYPWLAQFDVGCFWRTVGTCWHNSLCLVRHFGQIEAWSVSLKGVLWGAGKPVWQGNWWRWLEMMLVDLFLRCFISWWIYEYLWISMIYGSTVSWKSMIWMFWDLVRYDRRTHRDGCCQVGKNIVQPGTGWQLMTIDDKAIWISIIYHMSDTRRWWRWVKLSALDPGNVCSARIWLWIASISIE